MWITGGSAPSSVLMGTFGRKTWVFFGASIFSGEWALVGVEASLEGADSFAGDAGFVRVASSVWGVDWGDTGPLLPLLLTL